MGSWIFMLIMNLLTPFIMIVFGWRFMRRPPKKINGIYGYRTAISMKNQDTWEFAHKYCGKIWYTIGWGLLLITVATMISVLGKEEGSIATWGGILCIIQCIILVGTIFPTERALKNTFDKNGIRKNSRDN